jgi:hypothetical protein
MSVLRILSSAQSWWRRKGRVEDGRHFSVLIDSIKKRKYPILKKCWGSSQDLPKESA